MYFEQFKVEGLGCYSYLIGCPGAGTACVVDPERNIERYLVAARKNNVRITHIFDTHLHADHVSGALELAQATEAVVCIHPLIDAGFEHQDVRDGEIFTFGNARITVLETPGHTPNSISLAVADLSRSEDTMFLCTGDLLFVGDIGRPDLAGENLLEEQVRNLYHSLYVKLQRFPDYVEVYPAHGMGSLCGKGMSAKPMSTLGFERQHNPLLDGMEFPTFRGIMTGEFEIRPPGFMAIVEKNREGPPVSLGEITLKVLGMREVEACRKDPDVSLVDIRTSAEFGAAYLPGSVNIGLVANSAMWLGMTISADRRLIIITDDYGKAVEAARQYRRVGFDRIIGTLSTGVDEYVNAGYDLGHLPQLTVRSLKHVQKKYPDHKILDVRNHMEQKRDPFPGAVHVPLPQFVARGIDWARDEHITVVCGSGYRSNIVGSMLKSRGYEHVFCLLGGISAWRNAPDVI
ncbi:MBL fold metallo-hydrolase [bacterium]|nr:MBL fold metallo-hydrolase [candidate division CSSED10-310 bacterium]